MDMVLYALVNSKLEKQDSCSSWSGFKIEVVDKLPQHQVPNVIYLIATDMSVEDIISKNE